MSDFVVNFLLEENNFRLSTKNIMKENFSYKQINFVFFVDDAKVLRKFFSLDNLPPPPPLPLSNTCTAQYI